MRLGRLALSMFVACAAVAVLLLTPVAGSAGRSVAESGTAAKSGGGLISSAATLAIDSPDAGVIGAAGHMVWKIHLDSGERLYLEASATAGTGSLDLYLYGPSADDTSLVLPDDDKVVASVPYSHYFGSPASLRLAYTVPAESSDGWYYVDAYSDTGNVSFVVTAKHGPDTFAVTLPSIVGWTQRFTIRGTIRPTLGSDSDISHSSIVVWAFPRGFNNNGSDARYKLASASLISTSTWYFPTKVPNTRTLPWSSFLYVEWTGYPAAAWVDGSKALSIRPGVSIKPSKRTVSRGAALTLSGRVDPTYARSFTGTAEYSDRQKTLSPPRISIQGRPGRGAWRTLTKKNGLRGPLISRRPAAVLTVSSGGTYKYTVAPPTRGKWQYRIYYTPARFILNAASGHDPGGTTFTRYAAGYSAVLTIAVR